MTNTEDFNFIPDDIKKLNRVRGLWDEMKKILSGGNPGQEVTKTQQAIFDEGLDMYWELPTEDKPASRN